MAKRTTFVLDRDSSDLSSLSEDSSSESSEQTRKRAKTKQISAKKNIGKVSNGPKKSAVSDVKELDSQRDALVNNKQLEKDGVLLPAGYSVALNALISFCDLNQRLLEVGNTDNLFSLLATTRFGKLELQKLTWRIRRQPLEEFQEQVSDLINFAAANLLAQRKENKATIALKNHLAELAAVLPTLLQSEALRKFDGASSDTGALAQATEKREAKEGKREKNPRGVAEKLVAKRSINVTGVRTGETIVGNQGLCAGTVIENVGCNVPPVLEDVLLVKSFDDLWEKLIASLVDLEFFREMSSEDRGNWIVDHAEPETLLHMMDMDGVAFKVIVLGKNDNISKLSGDELDELMAREEISARELADMFPRNTGSTTLGGHHTLFTGRNYWKIMPRDPSTESVSKDTLVINVARFDEPAVRFGPVSCGPSEELVRIIVAEFEDESEQGSTPYACLFNERGVQMHFQTLCSHYGISQDIADQFTLATSQLTCAALKSLLQKLVRFRPGSVLLPRDLGQMAAVDTLKCCFLALLCSSGSFVPDIQRFVSGVESALKRLAVIAFEDSYPSNPRLLAELLACAFISQRYKTWRPNLEQITRWLDYLVGLHAADSAIVYDLARGSSKKRTSLVKAAAEISKSDSTGHYMAASALIDVVRSFAGDLSMIRDICTTPPTKWAITKVSEQTGTNSVVMPLHHCVDQHWAPEVAYFFGPITWLYEECARGAKSIKASTPFAGILSRLFNEVTGTNPRRTKCAFNHYEFEKNDFVKRARDAQHACLLSIQLKAGDLLKRPKVVEEKREHKPSSVDMNEASVEVNVELPDAWLSGLLGTIEVQKGKMLAALVPDNISSAMVAKRPAVRKNNKKGDDDSSGSTRPTMTAKSASVAAGLSEDAETLAGEAEFWEKLSRGGFPLDAIPMAPLKDLQGSTLRYDGESFQLRLANGEEIPWDAARKANIVLPLLQSPVQSVENLSQVAEALLGLGSVDWISYVDYVRESITYDDDGITNNAGEVWSSIISPLFRRHPGAGRRLLSYLQRNSPEIEINRLGREGGGSEAAVIVHDAGAFHLLLILSWLYPGVLGRVPGRLRFVVRCPPKLWEIRTELQEMLSSLEQVSENKTSQPRDALWAGLGDSTRTMIGYQQELTDELLDAHARGRTGHFLWLPPGAGKTKIVCETLTQLVANGKLPPYVVYCLPKENFVSWRLTLQAQSDTQMRSAVKKPMVLILMTKMKMSKTRTIVTTMATRGAKSARDLRRHQRVAQLKSRGRTRQLNRNEHN
ncbi:hypothetical protein BJ742DRAFT_234786 [Cladochytrium replicatum]|nr:hypothetical protein BJ742DRAFT_234786 [Cladochytrium replicatum]